jgi:hypothetical protein
MKAASPPFRPPTDIDSEQEAVLSREILDQVGGALRAYYASGIATGASPLFDQHLAALERVEEVHRRGIDAVRRSLE